MINAFYEFYNFLTYNPENISITEIIVPVATCWIMCALILFVVWSIFLEKIVLKKLLISFLISPYFILSILWEIYFIDENIFITLIPVYLLLILYFIIRLYRYIKKFVSIEMKRKIATGYLKAQYDNAKKCLEKSINNAENNDIEIVISKVRNVGIAYAQTAFFVYKEDGSFCESCINKLDVATNEIQGYSLFNNFIEEMECYIKEMREGIKN